jgi:O-antigen ligase
MLLVLVQFAFGKIDYFSQALLVSLYMLWAALLIMLGQRLREEVGLPALASALAAFLLLGAELNTLAGVLQHFHWHSILDHVVTVNPSGGVFGNLAQPNHFADYLTLGLVSLVLLHTCGQLRAWQAALLAAPMLFVLVLSGSRSTWLYLLFMVGLAFLWQRRDKTNRLLLHGSLMLVLGFVLMHFVVRIPWLSGAGSLTTWDRLTSGGGVIRLHIWYEAWLIFAKFPLLGAGFGQFGWQHFLLGPSLHDIRINGLYNNAHNLVMQTAAEMGLAGLLVLFGTLTLWIRQLRNLPHTVYHWWGGCVLAVLAIHSLLEYPLWYVYFLGVAALTLGMLDGTTYRLELRSVGRLSVASILLLGLLSLLQLWQGYHSLVSLLSPQQASTSYKDYFNKLLVAHRQALLRPYVEFAVTPLMEGESLADMRDLNESVMHFLPVNSVVYREASLLASSGEQTEAQLQMERAIWAYPTDFPVALERLRSAAKKDPAHLAALLEFAPKKYEEYQRAVLAK